MNKFITLSIVAFLSSTLYAQTDVEILQEEVKALMDKVAELEQKLPAKTNNTGEANIKDLAKKIKKLEKKQVSQTKKLSKINSLTANDNLKFNVDFRTSYDKLTYKTTGGMYGTQPTEYNNDALYSMRLWLGMGYAPTDDMVFNATLGVNKAFGASYGQRATGMGFDTFDWVVNETLTDEKVRLREIYWLWKPTLGSLPMTVSIGRRPATNGYLINLRDDDKAKSAIGHIINMEFDGASVSAKFDKYVSGMYFKACVGRGLTNAASWASQGTYYVNPMAQAANQPNYTTVDSSLDNTDMIGFIFQPYDDGQYSVMTKYYRGIDVPGLTGNEYYQPDITKDNYNPAMMRMKTLGDMDGAAISAKIEGIGNEINDFLDETIIFASYAWSKTRPADGESMLGSTESQTGDSYWLGIQTPNLTGGKFGLEYNHGSKYWRPFTYGEDTMAGSKMAVRGDAYEAYWTQPIIDKVFSMQIRYTYMSYDYTGSDGFFGDGGTPYATDSMMAKAYNSVTSASDLRVYFRYRY